ncbi:response regulator transcription factor [Arthrobacter polaris]|uniref:response regulator transcription factor n=1 Tax=Arthrobacter polaris TaxID=2813727 RepID=UPI003D7CDB10
MIRNAILKLGRVKPSIDDGQVLTLREQEIALQAAEGASNKAIASKMHISVRTVEGHLYQVYSKLQVTSRAELREILA